MLNKIGKLIRPESRYMLLACVALIVTIQCNSNKVNKIDTNLLLGKWKGNDSIDSICLDFTQQNVSISYGNNRVFQSKYRLNNDTLYIEKFKERSKISELDKNNLRLFSFDSMWNESISLIYATEFHKE